MSYVNVNVSYWLTTKSASLSLVHLYVRADTIMFVLITHNKIEIWLWGGGSHYQQHVIKLFQETKVLRMRKLYRKLLVNCHASSLQHVITDFIYTCDGQPNRMSRSNLQKAPSNNKRKPPSNEIWFNRYYCDRCETKWKPKEAHNQRRI